MYKCVFAAFIALSVGVAEAKPDDCETGFTKYDDGVFESGYGASSAGSRATYVMRFVPPQGNHWITAICVCWTRTNTQLSSVVYDIDIWPGNGSLTPVTYVLQSYRLGFASNVPLYPSEVVLGEFSRTNMTSFGRNFSVSGPVFVGPRWTTSLYQNFFVCSDENGPGGQSAFLGLSNADPATNVSTGTPEYKALGVRVKFENVFDVDGDGAVLPLTDGLLFLRWGFGFRGPTLTNSAVGEACTRCTPEGIAYYLGGDFQAAFAETAPQQALPSPESLKEMRTLVP